MTKRKIPTVNLFGEDGITIYLSEDHDLCDPADAVVRVVGRDLYGACSLEEAHRSIRRAYLARTGIPDPLSV